MRRARPALAIVLVFLAPGVVANGSGHVTMTAEQVAKQLKLPNAAAYAEGLYNDPARWNYVTEQIAEGQADWLQVAALLKQYADGGFSEELTSDLALALMKRPANVLRLLQEQSGAKKFRPDIVCSAPIPSPGKNWLKKYKMQAIEAVEAVRDTELQTDRGNCLLALRNIDLSLPAEAYR